MSQDGQGSDKRLAPFGRGVVTGLGAAVAAAALALGYVTRSGVVVTVETAALEERVAAEVRAAVRRELPLALEAVREELPGQVGAEARRRLSSLRVDLGGFKVGMPALLGQQVEQTLDQAVRLGLDAAVSRADVDGLADRIGGRAADLARDRLAEVLQGQQLRVEIAPGVDVPVRLRTR